MLRRLRRNVFIIFTQCLLGLSQVYSLGKLQNFVSLVFSFYFQTGTNGGWQEIYCRRIYVLERKK
jgi:hypothetical protein